MIKGCPPSYGALRVNKIAAVMSNFSDNDQLTSGKWLLIECFRSPGGVSVPLSFRSSWSNGQSATITRTLGGGTSIYLQIYVKVTTGGADYFREPNLIVTGVGCAEYYLEF